MQNRGPPLEMPLLDEELFQCASDEEVAVRILSKLALKPGVSAA